MCFKIKMENSNENDLETLTEEYVKSQNECEKKRKIYSELERIVLERQFSDDPEGVNTNMQAEKLKQPDAALSTGSLFRKGSRLSTKSKSSISETHLKKHGPTSDRSCFINVQKRILQFENYQNILKQAPNKHAVEFLKLLDAQNFQLSADLSNSESDD